MRFKKISKAALFCIALVAGVAHANEVLLTAKQPMEITYRIVHKNQNEKPVFDAPQTVTLNKNMTIPIDLNNYDQAGIVIVSAAGHELPPSANQFNTPRQCSMTTDKTRATGALEFSLDAHKATCRTEGGVFG